MVAYQAAYGIIKSLCASFFLCHWIYTDIHYLLFLFLFFISFIPGEQLRNVLELVRRGEGGFRVEVGPLIQASS